MSLLRLIVSIAQLVYHGIENYVMCYFISSMAAKAVSIGGIAYNSPWYQMSRNEQFMVEMIIRRSQRPYEIKGMGVFVCSLETYLKVNRFLEYAWICINIWIFNENSCRTCFFLLFPVDSELYSILYDISTINYRLVVVSIGKHDESTILIAVFFLASSFSYKCTLLYGLSWAWKRVFGLFVIYELFNVVRYICLFRSF